MPDTLETKAVKRLLRWVSLLTAVVLPIQEQIRVQTPDPWTAALLFRMKEAFEQVQQAGFGFGLLNDKSLEGLFLQFLILHEFDITPWGRLFQHLVQEGTQQPGKSVFLSRLPFILLPQECVVIGKSLGLTQKNYNRVQGGKGKIKLLEASESWKVMQRKLRASLEATVALEGLTNKDQLLKQHRENFSIHWEVYKILTEKAEMHYTPRYHLFPECQDIAFHSVFLDLFFDRIGRDKPISQDELPPIFDQRLIGKRITDFVDANAHPVDAVGDPVDEDVISLKQLDDFFLYT